MQNVNVSNDNLATTLHYACKGNIEVMECLLQSGKIDVNAKDKDDITPLLSVISAGCSLSLDRTKLLLQHKMFDFNATTTISGISGTAVWEQITPSLQHYYLAKLEKELQELRKAEPPAKN